jgi:hypothetical protein
MIEKYDIISMINRFGALAKSPMIDILYPQIARFIKAVHNWYIAIPKL